MEDPSVTDWRQALEDTRALTELAADSGEVIVLGMCEQGRVICRPDTLYRFVVMQGCDACTKLETYRVGK